MNDELTIFFDTHKFIFKTKKIEVKSVFNIDINLAYIDKSNDFAIVTLCD